MFDCLNGQNEICLTYYLSSAAAQSAVLILRRKKENDQFPRSIYLMLSPVCKVICYATPVKAYSCLNILRAMNPEV